MHLFDFFNETQTKVDIFIFKKLIKYHSLKLVAKQQSNKKEQRDIKSSR